MKTDTSMHTKPARPRAPDARKAHKAEPGKRRANRDYDCTAYGYCKGAWASDWQ